MTWKVTIVKNEKDSIQVSFEGELNTYEVMSVLDLEREKLRQSALGEIK